MTHPSGWRLVPVLLRMAASLGTRADIPSKAWAGKSQVPPFPHSRQMIPRGLSRLLKQAALSPVRLTAPPSSQKSRDQLPHPVRKQTDSETPPPPSGKAPAPRSYPHPDTVVPTVRKIRPPLLASKGNRRTWRSSRLMKYPKLARNPFHQPRRSSRSRRQTGRLRPRQVNGEMICRLTRPPLPRHWHRKPPSPARKSIRHPIPDLTRPDADGYRQAIGLQKDYRCYARDHQRRPGGNQR